MNEIAISVHGLGKRYRIGAFANQAALRERLTHAMKAPVRWLSSNGDRSSAGPRSIWALRDISFELRKGEVVGLIGRNGAGKSTLLKILSRITQPTEGTAEIHGRVGSLLEVGTGFHPELTGRENTYLNGAILGMGKKEIGRKFDEIVAFAEVADFIDTPLKHYSTGMQMRLAFAVAAHLEPEILLVDEVLAVGDLAFQKKCLGKMGEVARVGRTIVFVSHQMNQIRRLCQRVIWVDEGHVRMDGHMSDVLAAYESVMLSRTDIKGAERGGRTRAQFTRWEIESQPADRCHVLSTLGSVTVNFYVELAGPLRKGVHGVALFNAERQLMWGHATQNLDLEPGITVFSYAFPMLPLRPGPYQWQVSLWDGGEKLDLWDCLPEMNIATEGRQHYRDEWNGILNIPSTFAHWSKEREEVTSVQTSLLGAIEEPKKPFKSMGGEERRNGDKGSHTVVPKIRRFLSKSNRQKLESVAFRVRSLLPKKPTPIVLPFGARWLLENSALDSELRGGNFERAEAHFVEQFLRRGMTVLDIGAHHGFYTLLASLRVGSEGKVIAFEPSPRERKRLGRHVRFNKCKNVRVEPVALGNIRGKSEFFLVEGVSDYCNSLRLPAVEERTRTIQVDVTSLDQYLSRSRIVQVDFIKLDVEGAELDVLRGAKSILESGQRRPVLLVEVFDIRTRPWGYPARDIVHFLHRLGYEWFRPAEDGALESITIDSDAFDLNLAALPRERAPEILRSLPRNAKSAVT